MRIITANPVLQVHTAKKSCPDYSDMDASSSTRLIKGFQDWLDVKYPTWYKGGKLNKQSGYGTFGPATQSAYKQYGSEFESGAKAIGAAIQTPFGEKLPDNVALTDNKGNQKPGHFFDKIKGAFVKAKDAGILDKLKQMANRKNNASTQMNPMDYQIQMSSPDTSSDKKWSTGKKVAVIGGGLLIVALIVYAATRKGKKAKA